MSGDLWIVGSAGFIGRHLRRHLARSDFSRIVCIDQATDDAPLSEREQVLTARLGDPAHHEALFAELAPIAAECRAIVFLAAYYDFASERAAAYDRFHEGFVAFVDEAFARVPATARFVYASSMAAMEPTEPGAPLTADSPRSSAWHYPAAKRRCEDYLESHPAPNPVIELVLAGVYSDDCELVPLFNSIELVRRGRLESLFYPADPDRGLTYVHVDDVCRAFEAALRLQDPRGTLRYLVGEPRPCTQRYVMDLAFRTWRGGDWRRVRVPRWLASSGAWALSQLARLRGRRTFFQPWMMRFAGEHFEFDLTATEKELGWSPAHSVHDDLPEILERARRDPERWLRKNGARPW